MGAQLRYIAMITDEAEKNFDIEKMKNLSKPEFDQKYDEWKLHWFQTGIKLKKQFEDEGLTNTANHMSEILRYFYETFSSEQDKKIMAEHKITLDSF